jgi:hypothetical protein
MLRQVAALANKVAAQDKQAADQAHQLATMEHKLADQDRDLVEQVHEIANIHLRVMLAQNRPDITVSRAEANSHHKKVAAMQSDVPDAADFPHGIPSLPALAKVHIPSGRPSIWWRITPCNKSCVKNLLCPLCPCRSAVEKKTTLEGSKLCLQRRHVPTTDKKLVRLVSNHKGSAKTP